MIDFFIARYRIVIDIYDGWQFVNLNKGKNLFEVIINGIMILLKRMIVYMKQMINMKLNEINHQVFMLDQAAGTAQLQVLYFE